jgi:hypothetical protein
MKWRIAPLGAIGLFIVVGINAWLLTALVTEVVSDNLAATEKVDWQVSLSASAGSVANRRPIEAYGQILARPVFSKSREPFVPVPPPPPPAVKQTPPPVAIDPGLVLGGVMIKNDIRKAYVFSGANTNGLWISEGGDFMGWELKSISGTGAKLEQNGRLMDLQLYPKE